MNGSKSGLPEKSWIKFIAQECRKYVLTHENIENISEISEYPIGISTYTRMSDRSWLDSTQSHFTITLKFLYELDMEFCALEKILLSFSPPLSIFNNGKYFFKAKANIFVSYDIQWMRKCVVKKDNQSFIHFLSVEFRESRGEEKGENATISVLVIWFSFEWIQILLKKNLNRPMATHEC